MICENCKSNHSGSYGSGRFCSSKCARGFSTKAKRIDINRKVSEILKTKGSGYIDGRDSIRENCNNCGKEIRPTKYHLCRKCLGTNLEYRKISSVSKIESFKLNPEIRKKISINNRGGRCKWYTVNGQKVQGTWEKNIAEKLTELNIEWITARKDGRSFQYKIAGKAKTYTPDFYLPKFDIYLETKGFWWGKDKEKISIVRNTYKNLNLIVLEKKEYENFLLGILPTALAL